MITSRHNAQVVRAAGLLSSAKKRRESGEFAAEGHKLLYDAAAAGVEVTLVLAAESCALDESRTGDARVERVSDSVFESISTQRSPQGVIFTAKRPERRQVRDGALIVLDGVQDPGNVGTVIRTAAAFAAGGVILTGGCADPFSHKVVRASMGGVFRVPVLECSPEELPELCGGRALAAAMPRDDAKPVGALGADIVPVIGSEGQGISREVLDRCSDSFYIPMPGGTESLNAAVAAVIALWEISGLK